MLKTLKARRLIENLRYGSVRENRDTVYKLRAIGKPAVKALIQGLRSSDSRIRLESIRALGHMRNPSAIQPLEELLHHEDGIVRQYASTALARIKGEPIKNQHNNRASPHR